MATIEQLEQALIKAHRSGDERAAKLISGKIEGARSDEYLGVPSDQATFGEKIVGGLKHAWDKAAYGLEGAVKGTLGLGIDKEHKADLERGKAFVNRAGGAAKVGEFVGDVLPYMAGGSYALRHAMSLPKAMGLQAGIGATVTPESFGERLKSGALAGAGEGVGNVLVRSLGRLTGGVKNIDPQAQRMIDEGIYPTLGGLKGGRLKEWEDKLTSMPGLGDAIKMGRRGAIDEMNLAALRRGDIPEDVVTKIGHGGQEQLENYFNKQFGDALEGIRFDLTDPRIQEAVLKRAQENYLLGNGGGLDTLENFFKTNRQMRNIPEPTPPGTSVATKVDPNIPTYVSGKDFHAILQDLRKQSTMMRRNPNNPTDVQNTGNAMRQLYDDIQNIARQQGLSNEGALDAFDLARRQYASTAPARRAGSLMTVAGQKGGVFTPRQYANANIANMNAMGQKSQARTGKGFNQTFAKDAVDVLGENYPDSGTIGRGLTGLAMGGGIEYLLPGSSLAVGLPTLGAAALLNTSPGRRYLAGALPGQKALSNAIRSYAPYGGMVGAGVVGPMGSDY